MCELIRASVEFAISQLAIFEDKRDDIWIPQRLDLKPLVNAEFCAFRSQCFSNSCDHNEKFWRDLRGNRHTSTAPVLRPIPHNRRTSPSRRTPRRGSLGREATLTFNCARSAALLTFSSREVTFVPRSGRASCSKDSLGPTSVYAVGRSTQLDRSEDCGDKKNLLKKHQSGFGGSPYYPPFESVSTDRFFANGP